MANQKGGGRDKDPVDRQQTPSQVQPSDSKGRGTLLTSHFKMIFLWVVVITVGCLVAYVWVGLAIQNPNDTQKAILEVLSSGWKTGFGAIVGLVGGKSIS